MPLKVAIVGRPNVGKSSLFNRIIGERLSITADKPGVTRDRLIHLAEWLDRQFYLIDTGGITLSDMPFIKEIKMQVDIAIKDSDVIVFVTDLKSGVTSDDQYIAKLLYKADKPVILVANKFDNLNQQELLYDFYELGFGEPLAISSLHGIGVGDLLDRILKEEIVKSQKEETEIIHFSLIGRPNVGKSTLTNALLAEDRVITSNIPGTTRDSIDTYFTYNKDKYSVIDTAGLQKKGRIYEDLDKYAEIRTLDAILRSDVVLLMIDLETGILEQDYHVGEYLHEYSKPAIIVCNKWDLVAKDSKTMAKIEEEIREKFKYLSHAPIVFLSALDNKRVLKLFPLIKECYTKTRTRLKTALLNDCIRDATWLFPPSEFNGGKLAIYYVNQTAINPPTFLFHVNNPNFLHFSYKRYLENQLRKNFDLFGTPIVLEFRKRD